MTSKWRNSHLGLLSHQIENEIREFTGPETTRVISDLYLWDPWPVLSPNGTVATLQGAQLWMALSAPANLEPSERHDVARIRLLSCETGVWRDHGNVFEEGAANGSREWAGCATYFADLGELQVCYTASGKRGEQKSSFIQRIFVSTVQVVMTDNSIALGQWTPHRELLHPGRYYQSTLNQLTGAAGYIKAFRDPFYFIDSADGRHYVLFTASLADSQTDFDGVVGVACGSDLESLTLLPPLLTADGVNNELERPHIVTHDGLYYLFFSTQSRTFHPDVSGPTGLYGFVAESMDGEWRPLNGSGLVLRNPVTEPFQGYSWYVMQDLAVASFIDFPNLDGAQPEEVEAQGDGRNHFVGAVAPMLEIALQGDRAVLKCEGQTFV